jgi:hypothetical protein
MKERAERIMESMEIRYGNAQERLDVAHEEQENQSDGTLDQRGSTREDIAEVAKWTGIPL